MPPSEITTRVTRLYMRPDGIAVSVNLPDCGEQKLADAKENIRALGALAGGARVPLYVDSSVPTIIDAEARKYYLSEEAARHVSAMAIVSGNMLSRVFANLLIPVQRAPVPMQLFATETEALAWLRRVSAGRGRAK